MTRQLLALLALLTGLAAVGTPVSAAEAQALSCEIGASAEVSSGPSVVIASAQLPLKRTTKFATKVPAFKLPRADEIAPQTVRIGIDRAYE